MTGQITGRTRRSLLAALALGAAATIGALTMSQADTTAKGTGQTAARTATQATAPDWSFPSIYGGSYAAADFKGKAILLVNTASLCGYTPQFTALQQLQDSYKDQGLVVLAVPSDDFHQEKASNDEVKDFCEITYGITLPMTEIAKVTGAGAHPLYQWLQTSAGFAPDWNFNKVLFDRNGHVAQTWGSDPEPMGGEIEAAVRQILSQG